MKLYVKNKMITIGGGSYVEDDAKKRYYQIKGKVFSFTQKKLIYDMEGKLLYVVRNKFFRLFKTSAFIYDADGNMVGLLSNHDFDFKNKYVLQNAKDEIVISGKLIQFPNMHLDISKNGKPIGSIIKQFNLIRDAFILEIEDEQEAPLMVALVIAIDNILDNRENRSYND